MTISPALHDQLIADLRCEAARNRAREGYLIGSLLAGRKDATLFGVPIRISVEWPEGLPPGMTEDDLRAMGEKMLAQPFPERPAREHLEAAPGDGFPQWVPAGQ